MESNVIYEKILKRNKAVIKCGNTRNLSYSQYLKTSSSYDNLKKGFYIALQLSKHDGDLPDEDLDRFEYLVKHFDQQLLSQMKERDYTIQKIQIENDEQEHPFPKRIFKIEEKELLRNRLFYEFMDNKKEFNEAKTLFQNEISLALTDELITNIDYKIHIQSMELIEKDLHEGMIQIRKNSIFGHGERFNFGRGHNGGDQGRNDGGRGRNNGGRGRNKGGRGRSNGGRGRNNGGRGRNDGGRGRNDGGRGRYFRGQKTFV